MPGWRRRSRRICARIRPNGGWPLYHGGEFDMSCTVKAYYALKLAGDDVKAPHMVRARAAILERGGAARANVFTRIALALVRPAAVARRALHPRRDHAAAEVVLLPSRQGVVLVAHGHGAAVHPVHAQAAAPRTRATCTSRNCSRRPPEQERDYFRDSRSRAAARPGACWSSIAWAGGIDPLDSAAPCASGPRGAPSSGCSSA